MFRQFSKAALAALVLSLPVQAQAQIQTVPAACGEGRVGTVYTSGGWIGGITLKQTAKGVELNGSLAGRWLKSTVKETAQGVRIEGWLGDGTVNLKVNRTSDDETRISGLLGTLNPVSLRIRAKKADQPRVSGFGPKGSVSLTLFRGERAVLAGILGKRSIRLEADRSVDPAEELSLSGLVGERGEFLEVSVSRCLDALDWSNGMSTAEMMAVLLILTQ